MSQSIQREQEKSTQKAPVLLMGTIHELSCYEAKVLTNKISCFKYRK